MILASNTFSGPGNHISHYTDDSFTLAGQTYPHPIVLRNDGTVATWQVQCVADLDRAAMQTLIDTAPSIIVIGLGRQRVQLPQWLWAMPLTQNIGLEVMDTRSACHCCNLLLEEGRSFTAALLPAGVG